MSGIPHHADLHPCRKIYLTSWFMLSVLFLTGSETSQEPPPWQECLPDQLVHSVCVVFSQGVRHLWSQHKSGISYHKDLHPGSNIYLTSWFIMSVLFLTFSETSVVPSHVQNPPSHGLHPGRNVYLTSWVILSVLVLTDCETSVVPTCVRDPPSHRSPP